MAKNRKRKASETLHSKSSKKQKEDEVPLGLCLHHLNNDCLMNIFQTFSIKDLVHIAEADDRLLVASREVFRRNFSKSTVDVSNKFTPKIETTSLSAKLIKHFGDLITKLKVVYHKKYSRFNDTLDDAILDKCQPFLLEIEIENGDQLVFHKIVKPFVELRKVSFVSSNVPDVNLHFDKWFPKANTLELKQLKIESKIEKVSKKAPVCENDSESDFESDSKSGIAFYGKHVAALAKSYPTVEHFAISNVPEVYKCENRVRNRDIQKFIQLNPQLRSLFVESDDIDHNTEEVWAEANYSSWSYDGIEIEEYFAECIQKHLTNLEHFHLIWKTGESNDGCEFHFEKLTTLTIEHDIRSGHFYVGTDNVDVLNIVGKSESVGYCVDLLEWNKTAIVVNISGNWCNKMNVTTAMKHFTKMPNLKELRFSYNSPYIQTNHIISVLSGSKTLTKVTLDFDGNMPLFRKASKDFDTRIDVNWEIVSRKNSQLVLLKLNI